MKAASTVGSYEFLALGDLGRAAYAGLWCVIGSVALSGAWWLIGSRLSGTCLLYTSRCV